MKTFKKKLASLNDVLNIQGQKGNWDYDPYMQGLYNGLCLARSIMTETEPEFRDTPKRWLGEKTLFQNIKYWLWNKTHSSEGNKTQ